MLSVQHLSLTLNTTTHRHPYHPQKTLKHCWEGAPGGQVHITHTTVLALSGRQSNTQFAYWAHHSEAGCNFSTLSTLFQVLSCICATSGERFVRDSTSGV